MCIAWAETPEALNMLDRIAEWMPSPVTSDIIEFYKHVDAARAESPEAGKCMVLRYRTTYSAGHTRICLGLPTNTGHKLFDPKHVNRVLAPTFKICCTYIWVSMFFSRLFFYC